MAQLQTLPKIPDRFIDLADVILSAVIKQAGEATRIDFVADQYPTASIKNIEREKRGRSDVLVGRNVSTVTTVNSAMMRTTPPVVRRKMTC